MAITAASSTTLALLGASDRPMLVHSIFATGVNLRCNDHLIYASNGPDGGAASLCMTAEDVELLGSQPSWNWKEDALVSADRQAEIPMVTGIAPYPTFPFPIPLPSTKTPYRLARARVRAGRPSWFDTGVGLRLGLPRLRNAVRALVGGDPHAAQDLRGIVGLGAGLTPSADDALIGALCLLSADRTRPVDLRNQMLRWLRAEGETATTDVSMSYLRLAVGGAFSLPVTQVVGCLAESTSQAELDEAVHALSELGATSGMDTALGIQLACEFLTQPIPTA